MMPQSRFRIVHGVLVTFAAAIVAKAAHVQLWEHDTWVARADRQQIDVATLPAPRGDIQDATGLPVAHSRGLVRLSVAPTEVKDLHKLYKSMLSAGIPAAEARRATRDRRRKWIEVRGRYLPSSVAALSRENGVHLYDVGDRVYVQSEGTRRLLGAVARNGRGLSGLELQLDSLLQGRDGRARTVRGRGGNRFESPDRLSELPTRGHTVRLTINQMLQDICDKALTDAVRRFGASGGDVVILDPRTGAIRCMASRRAGGRVGGTAALTEPFEPGSTLKPFYAARLVERGLAKPDEQIETFNGRFEINGRVLTDVHKAHRMTLSEVIRFSSNIGIARFAERLSDGEMYELLRDLGFGTPSGLPYPSEAAGILRHPRNWTAPSHVSHAIGYELSVTPLQLAVAYTALANEGSVVAPALIQEIRDSDGGVVYTHRPQVLRRVFERTTVATLLPMLESVVDSGTATDAALGTFTLAGKSGTARRTVGGRYGASLYTSTFVGLFPARDPQYVVLAKIDNPRNESIYGGKVAAPLAKAVIEGALAAREASLDWELLAPQKAAMMPATAEVETEEVTTGPADSGTARDSSPGATIPPEWIDSVPEPEPEPQPPVTFDLTRSLKEEKQPAGTASVPEVRGMPLRVAARALHAAGFRVIVSGQGGGTQPPAGSTLRTGSLIRLQRP
jgi:cell division protein FtsI (penicillin-binding protein 3)